MARPATEAAIRHSAGGEHCRQALWPYGFVLDEFAGKDAQPPQLVIQEWLAPGPMIVWRPVDDLQKRWLLSTALYWIAEVDTLNAKVAFCCNEFNRLSPMIRASDLVSVSADHERRSALDENLLHAMRERFDPYLAGSLFSRLTYVTVTDLHVLALALEHIRSAAHHLRPALSECASDAAREYINLWKQIRELRNALEHEEEYLAGVGQKPHMVDPSWSPPAIGTSRRIEQSSDGLVAIIALGKPYRVREAIDCCLTRLGPHLREVMKPLSRSIGS